MQASKCHKEMLHNNAWIWFTLQQLNLGPTPQKNNNKTCQFVSKNSLNTRRAQLLCRVQKLVQKATLTRNTVIMKWLDASMHKNILVSQRNWRWWKTTKKKNKRTSWPRNVVFTTKVTNITVNVHLYSILHSVKAKPCSWLLLICDFDSKSSAVTGDGGI